MKDNYINWLRDKKYIIVFIIVVSFVISIPLYFYHHQNQQVIKLTEQKLILEKQQLNFYVERSLNSTRLLISRTLSLMAQGTEMHDYLFDPSEKNKIELEKFWMFIAHDQQTYSQIRFLDTQGHEKVRINYDSETNTASPATYLQDKSHRPYFLDSQTLKADERAIYALDLEKENGKYVIPYKAAYRVVQPVEFNRVRYGYMIINVDVQHYVHYLSEFRPDVKDLTLFNAEGFYILGPDENKLHGQVLNEREQFNIAAENPQLWHYTQDRKKGVYKDTDAIYVFKKVVLSIEHEPIILTAVSQINLKDIIASQQEALRKIQIETAVVILFIIALSTPFLIYLNRIEHRRLQNRLVYAAMKGISAVVVTNEKNKIITVNKEFTQITGYNEEDVIGHDPHILKSGFHDMDFYKNLWYSLHEKGEWEGEITNRRKDGQIITALSRIRAVKDKGVITNYIASFVDISERKQLEEKLRMLSERDALTHLWNRRIFEERLETQSQEIARYGEHHFCSLAILDIDFFKKVNDTYGHQKGDEVIQQVANVLSVGIRDVDTVARIGGEEFAIIMPYTHIDDAITLLNRKRIKIQEESDIGVTISGGVIELSIDCMNDDAYKAADQALYRAKETGRNKICS